MTTLEEQASDTYITQALERIVYLTRELEKSPTLDTEEQSILFSVKVLVRTILSGREEL